MKDEIEMKRRQIEISGARTMNLYTFELNGETMPEMTTSDLVQVKSETPTEQL